MFLVFNSWVYKLSIQRPSMVIFFSINYKKKQAGNFGFDIYISKALIEFIYFKLTCDFTLLLS